MDYTRRLLVNSTFNMRELGGYGTSDGRHTRYGRFIRSDLPGSLPDKDLGFLENYGVKTVVDLRLKEECAMNPSPFEKINGINYINIPFTEDFTYLGNIDYCPLQHIVPIMQGSHNVKNILEAMAASEKGGIIFNCVAGKDRTGIISVLLLLIANVPVVDVIADYQVTFTYIKPKYFKTGTRPGRPLELSRTDPEWIEPFLGMIDESGGIVKYLNGLGVDIETINILRDRMTEDQYN